MQFPWMRQKLKKTAVVLAGILAGQFVLYGPSLVGSKILLPLDVLAQPHWYIPQTPGAAPAVPQNLDSFDLVAIGEPSRHFVATELHTGRFPMWNPGQYGGAPEFFPRFSPFLMLKAAFVSPRVIPWAEALAAMVAGMGAYVFSRRVLQTAFWPAAIAGWCYPLTAFFVLWQGYAVGYPVVLLPWLLLAVDRTVRRASGPAGIGTALLTFMVLEEGHLDIAGQVLLSSGLYALWCYFSTYHRRWFSRQAVCAISAVGIAWSLGFLLAAPEILPALEYAKTGARMMRRSAGDEERPPVGLAALPQIVLPDMYGSGDRGSLPDLPENERNFTESPSAAYAGMLATLLLAPLGLSGDRRRRAINLFLLALGFTGLAWSLNVPGMVALLRMPGLNMMSHNRFTFAASFAVTALSASGLDWIWRGGFRWRAWHWLFPMLAAGLCGWCIHRAIVLPEPMATQLAAAVAQGKQIGYVHDAAGVAGVRHWFVRAYIGEAILCGLVVCCWVALGSGRGRKGWLVAILGILSIADLLRFDYGRNPQCDPSLYYPAIPALGDIAKSPPGRVIGYDCLPARLAEMSGLRDIRGYNAIDPARLMDLMALTADPGFRPLSYSLTQWFRPDGSFKNGTLQLPPILDMLGVRYIIFRGNPPPALHPPFQSPDYWALVNPRAMPRAFVPGRVETVADDHARLNLLAARDFNPREVAYVESPVSLPQSCRGTVEISSEIPTRVTLAARMETPGLVVLSDLWDAGWRASLNGRPAAILRTNHALRGVVVPAGESSVEFRYEPASLALGLRLAAAALASLAGWGILLFITRRRAPPR